MNMLHKSSQDVVAICTHEGSNGAAGEHKTWKCVFPCKNCGGTEAGPRRDRGGTAKCDKNCSGTEAGPGSNGAAGEHKTWKCVFPCKNCGGTEGGPRRDRGGTIDKYPFAL